MVDLAVSLPQEAETVGLVRAAVTHTLSLLGVADECLEDIRLAVSEACTNVIQHAAGEDEYEVALHVDDSLCSVEVKNAGHGVDSSRTTGAMPDASSAGGRGLAIMRAVMDRFEFTSTPEAGTVVRLVRHLSFRTDGPQFRLGRSHNGR